jgi:hypothetical protein
MTGGGVNEGAEGQEQQNQAKAQQYAAQQQAAALAALQANVKANPPPNSTAAPLQPSFAAPATMGGGTAPGSAQPQGQMRPPGGQPGAAPGGQPNPLATLPPQLKAALMAQLGQQGAPAVPKAM